MHITELSDRALKILVIILLAGQPVSRDYILARYHRPLGNSALQTALRELELEQMIARTAFRGPAFTATLHARQMILGESYPQDSTSYPQSYPQKSASYPQVEAEVPPGGTSSSSRGNFRHLDSSSSRCNTDAPKPPPLLLDAREIPPAGISPLVAENMAALAEYGINEPARSQLAALPHVTPRYIDAHCSRARAQKKDTPVAIYRIRNNWKPGPPSEAHMTDNGKARIYLAYLE